MIKLICVGKVKEKFFMESVKEYQKRLNRYIKLEIIEIDDIKGDNPLIIMEKESMQIEKYIGQKDYIITLEIEGKEYTSEQFSKKIESIQIQNPNITFIIGGSHGLDQKIKDRSNLAISFSKFTFPHTLFRTIFLEQLYRAYKIMHNETYHK